jgi:hypothetical protein
MAERSAIASSAFAIFCAARASAAASRRLTDEADMTMRAFVLDALKAKGLDVRADDLADLRKERR